MDEIKLKFSDYEKEGLYLAFEDKTFIDLTKENIEKVTEEFGKDPSKIPDVVKENPEFHRCDICPLREEGIFCNALMPVVPFLEFADRYVSFDKVFAIYKGREKKVVHTAETTMQDALKYVSILSLTNYCETGKKYSKYFWGVVPVMQPKDIALRLYLNIYWFHKANKKEIESLILNFRDEINTNAKNQVKRLNLICKNDAFMNAFVSTQIATEFLSMDIDKILESSFNSFETR